jgi:hypothetical protein
MGLIPFLAFGISVIAAVVAIDMYKLLRTGEIGASWRVLIIASVIFALTQALRLAGLTTWGGIEMHNLSEIADLIFVMALAYAFYLQRRVFRMASRTNSESDQEFEAEEENAIPLVDVVETDDEPATSAVRDQVSRADEWARLSGRYTTDEVRVARQHRSPD